MNGQCMKGDISNLCNIITPWGWSQYKWAMPNAFKPYPQFLALWFFNCQLRDSTYPLFFFSFLYLFFSFHWKKLLKKNWELYFHNWQRLLNTLEPRFVFHFCSKTILIESKLILLSNTKIHFFRSIPSSI